MIAIQLIHNDIRSQIKKYNSSFVSPSDIDIAINKAQYDVLDLIIKEYESKQMRASGEQDLLKLYSFTSDASERTLPTDVYKLSTVFFGDSEGDILDDKHFNDRLNSVIIPPTVTRPIATLYNDGASKIRIMPTGSTHQIKYWKVPTDAKYNFTQADGVITYNPSGSVDVGFPMSEYTKILNRTLFYLGIPSSNVSAATIEKNA